MYGVLREVYSKKQVRGVSIIDLEESDRLLHQPLLFDDTILVGALLQCFLRVWPGMQEEELGNKCGEEHECGGGKRSGCCPFGS